MELGMYLFFLFCAVHPSVMNYRKRKKFKRGLFSIYWLLIEF